MSGPPASPYKGLTPFEDSELDVLFFFGRERERELIEANLMASRLTVLYGETGVGKSSRSQGRRCASPSRPRRDEPRRAWRAWPRSRRLRRVARRPRCRRSGGPWRTRSRLRSARRSGHPKNGARSSDAFRMWQQILDGDLYVILDQAEEYFLYHGGEEGGRYLRGRLPRGRRQP